jgi:hypothetical protein
MEQIATTSPLSAGCSQYLAHSAISLLCPCALPVRQTAGILGEARHHESEERDVRFMGSFSWSIKNRSGIPDDQ